jgi:hypothetical protein
MTRHLIVFRHPFVSLCPISVVLGSFSSSSISFIINLRVRLCSYINTYVLSLSPPLVYLLRSISRSSSST